MNEYLNTHIGWSGEDMFLLQDGRKVMELAAISWNVYDPDHNYMRLLTILRPFRNDGSLSAEIMYYRDPGEIVTKRVVGITIIDSKNEFDYDYYLVSFTYETSEELVAPYARG